MKSNSGVDVTLSSTNQKQNQPRSRRKTNPKPYQAPNGAQVVRFTSNFYIVDLKDYDIAAKTIHFIQVNHVIEKTKRKNVEAEESLTKAQFIFKIDLKCLKQETSVDSKMLQLKTCVKNKQKEGAPQRFSPVSVEITDRFGLLFAGDRILVPEKLKRQNVDALHFGHQGSVKMLVEKKNILVVGNEEKL